MFTGLIQGMGKVRALGNDLFAIEIDQNAQDIIGADLALGDSVAVDGVCLTVEKIIKGGFVATASPETLERTILGKNIDQNKKVNLETSLRVGSKIGGHFGFQYLEKDVQHWLRINHHQPAALYFQFHLNFPTSNVLEKHLYPDNTLP